MFAPATRQPRQLRRAVLIELRAHVVRIAGQCRRQLLCVLAGLCQGVSLGVQHDQRRAGQRDDIVERVTGRRVCLDCGQTYHVRYSPPPQNGECVSCGGTKIVQRSDDTEEVVRKRYEEYKAKTEPVLAHYEAKGVVTGVEGVGSLEEITERIKEAIGVE